jgi:hypothetical protein
MLHGSLFDHLKNDSPMRRNNEVFFFLLELRQWKKEGLRKLNIEDESQFCDEEVLTRLDTLKFLDKTNFFGASVLR